MIFILFFLWSNEKKTLNVTRLNSWVGQDYVYEQVALRSNNFCCRSNWGYASWEYLLTCHGQPILLQLLDFVIVYLCDGAYWDGECSNKQAHFSTRSSCISTICTLILRRKIEWDTLRESNLCSSRVFCFSQLLTEPKVYFSSGWICLILFMPYTREGELQTLFSSEPCYKL